MAGIRKKLEGILKTGRKKTSKKTSKKNKKKKKDKDPIKIVSLNKQADVPKVLKLAKITPMILLSIKNYRKKNKQSLKKSLEKLKDRGKSDGIESKLLDQNWVVVLSPNTQLVR